MFGRPDNQSKPTARLTVEQRRTARTSPPKTEPRAYSRWPREYVGPGTFLKRSLSWFAIHEDDKQRRKDAGEAGCKCELHVKTMDEWGPDVCAANIETIVGWLRESAAERKLPFVHAAAVLLVKTAIHRSRKTLE